MLARACLLETCRLCSKIQLWERAHLREGRVRVCHVELPVANAPPFCLGWGALGPEWLVQVGAGFNVGGALLSL
jgi:hypothetical protein